MQLLWDTDRTQVQFALKKFTINVFVTILSIPQKCGLILVSL